MNNSPHNKSQERSSVNRDAMERRLNMLVSSSHAFEAVLRLELPQSSPVPVDNSFMERRAAQIAQEPAVVSQSPASQANVVSIEQARMEKEALQLAMDIHEGIANQKRTA